VTRLRNDPTHKQTLDALGTILLAPRDPASEQFTKAIEYIFALPSEQFEQLLKQAETQRVLRRSLEVLKDCALRQPNRHAQLLDTWLVADDQRVRKVLNFAHGIVTAFERRSYPVAVIKTLDHWPDTGSDVDLLAAGNDNEICGIFGKEFGATRQEQSWGDRLAHKFNFQIPGLAELVEVHIGCLGQTGEQKKLAADVLSRSLRRQYDDCVLPVSSVEDRIIIATLQRMYRHYYIRLTDIVNIMTSLANQPVDFVKLKAIAEASSVWPGVATLVTIVSQHGAQYGAPIVALPDFFAAAARFNSARTYVDQKFVRVPLMPEAANLYLNQVAENGRRHDFRAMARLSLQPMLATAAFVAFRLTGNDKGVW